MTERNSDTTPDYDCQDCIGMAQHGCYCKAMGAVGPGGPLFVPCETCQTEGRIIRSKGNDPDEIDCGPCPDCHGECVVEVSADSITAEECSANGN